MSPRVIFVRHGKLCTRFRKEPHLTTIDPAGETEWTKTGQHTSFSEIDLTPAGANQVSSIAPTLVGGGKLIDPKQLVSVIVSPRTRTRTTARLLLSQSGVSEDKINYDEQITEWNYGGYEGKLKDQIYAMRKAKGLDKDRLWDVWKDGCNDDGGE